MSSGGRPVPGPERRTDGKRGVPAGPSRLRRCQPVSRQLLCGDACAGCGYPSTHEFAGLSRCGDCSAASPVERPDQLAVPTRAVLNALASAGVTYQSRVLVELRSGSVLRRTGADGTLGLTRTLVDAGGRRAGRIVITMVAGLPDVVFRQVFAHELGHAVMYDRGITRVPLTVAEGMAEYFAHIYLTRDGASAAEHRLAAHVATNPDPIYGEGFRAVCGAIDRFGFRTVFIALHRQDLASIGLA